MSSESQPVDQARGIRRTATGILLGLLSVFLLTFIPAEPGFAVLLLRAMAEAGMVGALADWFAVEALFRRPLGLPIPHTALLPANQDRAAENISRFIDHNFLKPEQLLEQLRKVDPLALATHWLSKRENAAHVADELSWAISLLVRVQFQGKVPPQVRHILTDALSKAVTQGKVSDQVVDLMTGALDTDILDEILQKVRETIDENRDTITDLVQDRSRWWIASGIDRQLSVVLVDGVLSVLDELRDHKSPRRAAFSRSVGDIFERFREDGTIDHFLETSLGSHAKSHEFRRAMDKMLAAVLAQLEERLENNPEELSSAITDALQDITRRIETDAETRAVMEQRLETAILAALNGMRSPVRDYLNKTISDWDSENLVTLIEAEVGRDLQFIRINGSVLGAFLGGAFFLITHLILT